MSFLLETMSRDTFVVIEKLPNRGWRLFLSLLSDAIYACRLATIVSETESWQTVASAVLTSTVVASAAVV